MKICLFCEENPVDTKVNNDKEATLCKRCWLE